MNTAPRRRYSSALRAEQARPTRGRILDAAEELFLADGYGTTTITQATRDLIADTARRLFAADGYGATSMETIAREGGVARRTMPPIPGC